MFSSSGSTTATISAGVVTFTGNVGFIDDLSSATGLPNEKNIDCRVLDFSYTKCTVVDEGSTLFASIKAVTDSKATAYYGVVGDTRNSKSFVEVFKQNRETGDYEYDSSAVETAEGREATLWFVDEKDKTAKAFDSNAIATGTKTVLKDFTACVECREVNQVPEPSSTLLVGLAGLAGLIRRKR